MSIQNKAADLLAVFNKWWDGWRFKETHFTASLAHAIAYCAYELGRESHPAHNVPPRYVYLAGPILGCTGPEANNWREEIARKLLAHNIVGISPLRCEPLVGEVYSTEYPDPCFGTARAIAGKNRFDVRSCEMGVFIIPKPPEGRLHSFGTLIELAWANADGKQTILVSDDPFIHKHPVIDACANWKLDTVDEAVRVIVGVLGGYTGGKNV
jgi:nucleoside 2-deoxyribosyltransferase